MTWPKAYGGGERSFFERYVVTEELLAEAKAVLEARAQERYEAEQAKYQAKIRAREEKAQRTGRKPRGRAPQPPVPGARAKDQYNFTDPESRIMKNSTGTVMRLRSSEATSPAIRDMASPWNMGSKRITEAPTTTAAAVSIMGRNRTAPADAGS